MERSELKRRYEMTLKMGADDLPSLRGMLNTLIFDLARLEDGDIEAVNPYHQISGGYSGNHSMKLELNPDVTHDSYMIQLEEVLEQDKHSDTVTRVIKPDTV